MDMVQSGGTNLNINLNLVFQGGKGGEQPLSNARLIGVPTAVQNDPRPQRLNGRVETVTKDGKIRIQTERGPVDVEIQSRGQTADRVLREGQSVEVEIEEIKPDQRGGRDIRLKIEGDSRQASTGSRAPNPAPARAEGQPARPLDTPLQVQLASSSSNSRADRAENGQQGGSTTTAPAQQSSASTSTSPQGRAIRVEPLGPNTAVYHTPPATAAASTTQSQSVSPEPFAAQSALIASALSVGVENSLSANSLHAPLSALPLPPLSETPLQQWQVSIGSDAAGAAPGRFGLSGVQLPSALEGGPGLTIPSQGTPLAGITLNESAPPLSNLSFLDEGAGQNIITAIKSASVFLSDPAAQTIPPQGIDGGKNGTLARGGAAAQPNPSPVLLSSVLSGAQGQIHGQIIGVTDTNLPVFQAVWPPSLQGQSFLLHASPADLPTHTELTLQPLNAVQTPGSSTANTAVTLPLNAQYFLTPEPWSALNAIQDHLQSLQNAAALPAASSTLASVLPQANNPAQMAPAILFFVAAIRGGDLSGLLSENSLNALKGSDKGSSLLTRLGQEGGALNRLAADPVSQDWRAMSIPMVYEGEIQKIALYYKHDHPPEDQDDASEKGRSRFIFDLQLDHMGKVQLDGMVMEGRLDLAVRTEQDLSKPMRNLMRASYIEALEQSQLKGELLFQNTRDHWVDVLKKADSMAFSI